jgi:hypothetical protein
VLSRRGRRSVRQPGIVCPEQDRRKCIGTALWSPANAEGCNHAGLAEQHTVPPSPDHDAAVEALVGRHLFSAIRIGAPGELNDAT